MSEPEKKHVDPEPAAAASADAAAAAATGAEGEKKLTKADIKAQRQAAKLAEEEAAAKAKAAELKAKFGHIFGDRDLINSTTHKALDITEIVALDKSMAGKVVTVRGRVETVRGTGKLGFIVLRQNGVTVQGVIAENADKGVPREMIKFASSVPCESIVDCVATVTIPEKPVVSTTKQDIELDVTQLHVVSRALPVLPFQLTDANRGEHDEGPKVNQDTRLNCRWLDMRTPASNAIFRLQSRVGQYWREFLLDHDFVEIHSPKIIGAASEGGANVFKLQYFDRHAYLAQSPQLYKQMAVQGDLPRVFEVAPVFRSENSNTHRHLTEFVGLDLEMVINEHYYEVLDVAEELFTFMFTKLHACRPELEAVRKQHPFVDLEFQVPAELIDKLGIGVIEEGIEPKDVYGARVRNRKIRGLRLPYARAIALLNTKRAASEQLGETDDINTENEKKLGALVKERYGVDFYISDRFPSCVRPFYTMPCPDDKRFTNSYDMFIRGEEISSGAQRIHDPELLLQRGKELGVDMAPLKDYVDSFRLGAWPHGGFGVGLERVVMLYLGLHNVRYASMFPRDPARVTP